MPTSNKEPTRPLISAYPVVGSVTRERIFNNVLFPAPLAPMNPTTSPALTSKETFCKAQNFPLDILWSDTVFKSRAGFLRAPDMRVFTPSLPARLLK